MIRLRLTHVVLGGLLAGVLWELRRHASVNRHERDKPAATPEDEVTWEGEGGALPDTGSQIGPEPAKVL